MVGGKRKFFGRMPLWVSGGGPGLVQSLTETALKKGIEIFYETRAVSLGPGAGVDRAPGALLAIAPAPAHGQLQVVQPAQLVVHLEQRFDGAFDHFRGGVDLALLGDVGAEGEPLAADLFQRLLGGSLVAIHDGDRCPGGGEQFRGSEADAAGAAGHDGDAALEAARLRFRPILMTAFAFILGVVPLMIASGAGAESRKVMGTAVFWGMLVATALGVFVTPALYTFVEWFYRNKRPPPAAPQATPPEGH